MRIAVLMSSYNGEKYIEQQIASILAQKCEAQVDLWVRDDGSTDTTLDILKRLQSEGKLRWYTGENLKPAKSFLNLVQHCCGYDFYAFADQDDVWYPDKLKNSLEQLQGVTGPAMSFANARLVDQELDPLGRNVYRNAPHTDFYSVTCGSNIMGCTIVFNAALAQLIQGVPLPQNLIMHDYYLAIVCTLHDGVILYDAAPCMDYRQHGNNVVGSAWKKTDALKERLRRLTVKSTNTLDKMAASICENYPQAPNAGKLRWLKSVSRYQESFFRAALLAADPKPTYNSWNMSITLRLSILLRNR